MRKGVILVVVIGIMLVIFTLALAALFLMTQQSRIAEHKIKRSKAFFAAQAGMVLALEQLRLGVWVPGNTYCLSNGIVPNPSGCFATVVDSSSPRLPYDAVIVVGALGSGVSGTAPVDIRVDY